MPGATSSGSSMTLMIDGALELLIGIPSAVVRVAIARSAEYARSSDASGTNTCLGTVRNARTTAGDRALPIRSSVSTIRSRRTRAGTAPRSVDRERQRRRPREVVAEIGGRAQVDVHEPVVAVAARGRHRPGEREHRSGE